MIKIMKYGEVAPDEIFARVEPVVDVEAIVTDIIKNVRQNGDQALFEFVTGFVGNEPGADGHDGLKNRQIVLF